MGAPTALALVLCLFPHTSKTVVVCNSVRGCECRQQELVLLPLFPEAPMPGSSRSDVMQSKDRRLTYKAGRLGLATYGLGLTTLSQALSGLKDLYIPLKVCKGST